MTEVEEVSYSELARRVGDCVLNNEIRSQLYGEYEFELVNGDEDYCLNHENRNDCDGNCDNYENYEIYQDYIITQSGAEYLQRNTEEIIYYCEKLNLYLWCITHYGTGWDCVFTTIGNKEN